VLKRTKKVSVPVTEIVTEASRVSKGKNDDGEEIFEEIAEVRKAVTKKVSIEKNIYEGYQIIPDDAVILTEDEYKNEIEKMKEKSNNGKSNEVLQTKKK
jgi:hypothetical protein